MILEVALIDIRPGEEEAFTAAYRTAHTLVRGTPGFRSIRMTRGVESPSRFVLLVEWDTVEAHLENFRETDRFTQWRGHIGPYFASPPVVEHFTDISTDA
ncbi:heme-degrading monooxygenase HmoA [Asanoa ferruginea]|uniref:Heme-degrading monooxygenase HmoA n=1 Tax=Asanoa ferruginea TaxID=53367 RepID=A0A3D9ZZ86_9ACTN|nr:antibiotic biosynthesis monooxygenase [Asanoa ferruginea]REG01995.1 heme-degrading monooxygenase HmoA [Asanoa ferruginea]GIF49894.1 antibiotic biosynthesis monooxygenase [Asanoa ferruginea]